MKKKGVDEDVQELSLDDSACTFELETTFDDNMGSYGNMFDIKTIGGEVSIFAMDIYVDMKKKVNYEIYFKANSFKDDNGKLSLKPWTLVKKGSVVGGGRHVGTPIRDFTIGNLTVAPNELISFYVTLDSADLRYRNITGEMPDAVVGDLFVGNDDIEVYVGVSVAGFPLKTGTQIIGKRAWSGQFYYRADRTCMPSASPSVVESASIFPSIPALSSVPTLSPSYGEPSSQPSLSPSTELPTSQPSADDSGAPSTFSPSFFPTSEISATPTRSDPDDWLSQTNEVLVTALDGGTGAFGNMFTVTSKMEPIRITALSLHSDFATGNITTMVFTKAGDFVGFENEPQAWRKISESTFRGAGLGSLSRIPTKDFKPLYLNANETVAIYVTMTTADMRYTRTNRTLGRAIASNDYIDINAGVGVADYPFASEFFLYSPRAFNGAVHFSYKSDRQPMMMNISYGFNVQHSDDVSATDLNRLIEDNVEMTARSLIETTPILGEYAKNHQVKVDSARAQHVQGSCKALSSKHVCTPVDTTVYITFFKTLREEELHFTWLKAYKKIMQNVNLMFPSDYIGDIPVEDARIISLHTREVPTPMSHATQRAFEIAVMRYLRIHLSKKNVDIIDVQVKALNMKSGHDINARRFLQRDSDDEVESHPVFTIDVSTNVNGNYRPPPDIDFSATVEDAMDAEPQDLEQSLRRADRYFEIIESTSSKKDDSSDTQYEAVLHPPAGESNSTTLLIVFLSLLVSFFLLVCGTWYLRRRRKFVGPSMLKKSEFLQDRKRLFGRYGNRNTFLEKTNVNADVTWARSADTSTMFEKPFSDSYKMHKDSHNNYVSDDQVAAQFQDVGTYGYSSQSDLTWGYDSYRSDFSGPDLGNEAQQGSFRSQ